MNTIKRVHRIQPETKSPHTQPAPSPTPSPSSSLASIASFPLTAPTSLSSHPAPGNYSSPSLTMISEIFTLQDRLASTTLLTTVRMLTTLSSSFLDRYTLLLTRAVNLLIRVSQSPPSFLNITPLPFLSPRHNPPRETYTLPKRLSCSSTSRALSRRTSRDTRAPYLTETCWGPLYVAISPAYANSN